MAADRATRSAQEGSAKRSLAPALALPTGGGAIRGMGETFTSNPARGTGSASIPIAIARGPGGFRPALALHYDSSAGNGPFGLGWSTTMPSITRRTDRGLPRYRDSDPDTFLLDGAEELVPAERFGVGAFDVQRYRPRSEGAFVRIERWTDVATGDAHWRTTTRDNLLTVFGRTPGARIADPDHPERVFTWLPEEIRDDRGNAAWLRYKAEDGVGVDRGLASEAARFDGARFRATAQRYLKRIHYGNRVPLVRDVELPASPGDWMFEVVFDHGEHAASAPTPDETTGWQVRPDAFSNYRAAFEVRTYRRCARVLMFHRFPELGAEPLLVSSTDFAYDDARIRSADGTFESEPIVAYLVSATAAGYLRRDGGAYERATLPAVEFDYTRAVIHDERRALDPAGIPGAARGSSAQWVDLDGEGLPGVLISGELGWYYRTNLGGGQLAPPVLERALPVPGTIYGAQLVDLGEDGNLDFVVLEAAHPGFFTRTADRAWGAFAPFAELPLVDWHDPELRMLDLDGDGLPDVLITRDDGFVWYRSLGTRGYDGGDRVCEEHHEELGPAVVFADGTETIHLADMSGDGLVDLVRVRNGEVCFWPNLGYGRFGCKVTLDRAPRFEASDLFDPRRVRFADIDGSGTSDVIYLGRDAVRVCFNQCGNALSAPYSIRSLPAVTPGSDITIADVTGNGTACVVWTCETSELRPPAYVDLMAGTKPHLLASIVNNLGSETRIAYESSTSFYLSDRAAGRPWLTRLAFPVHVVSRLEYVDRVSTSLLVRRFAYHHGYFDGIEREFRGFSRVDQWDAETLGSGDTAQTVPPVHTITWFHTGAPIEPALAAEYYAGDAQGLSLSASDLPPMLSLAEEREALRVLTGSVLRVETYAEDGKPASIHPYTVVESRHSVRMLQAPSATSHGVFSVRLRETATSEYERRPDDPRVAHELVLAVDEFNNVLRQVAVAYPRRAPAAPEQARCWAITKDATFANRPDAVDGYRVGVGVKTTTKELTGLTVPARGWITADALGAALAAASEIPYETMASGSALELRLTGCKKTLYLRDDLSAPLPLGTIELRAIPFETYEQTLTPGLVAQAFDTRVTAAMLVEAGYVLDDGAWWAPSGQLVLDPSRFYMPVDDIDPFGQHTLIRYDAHALLVTETENPLGERMTATNDYRVLGPIAITDANGNQTAVRIDALGFVVATAMLGKGTGDGDTLDQPTAALSYDLHSQPVVVHVTAREQHGAASSRMQETYTYSDGSGRIAMQKVKAAGGQWIGTGRTVYDNKGNIVEQYEPYFSTTPDYEPDAQFAAAGGTAVQHYDPLGRRIRTDFPDGTLARVVFDAWQQETWDRNDTVTESAWLAHAQAGNSALQRAAALALAASGTPAVAQFDARGQHFQTIADNGGSDRLATRYAIDIDGRELSVTDPRGVTVFARTFDMLGRPIHEVAADGGEVRALADVAGRPVFDWTARGQFCRRVFDALRRTTHMLVDGRLVERRIYGETVADAAARNLHGTVYKIYDGSGLLVHERFDLDGNLLATSQQLTADHRVVPDWSGDSDALLDPEVFTTATSYDALGRVTSKTTPDGRRATYAYDDGGRLTQVIAGEPIIASIVYNARGQRLAVDYGNATTCRYEYDPRTFRVARLRHVAQVGRVYQDATYTYDPVGNTVEVEDAVAFGNPAVSADRRYEFDATYRLTAAEGREQAGAQPSDADPDLLRLDNPNDLQTLRRYRETYAYDAAGNLGKVAHQPLGAGPPGWARRYAYATDSDRLLATGLPGDAPDRMSGVYAYDAHGNMTAMPHLAAIAWDHANRMQRADRGGGGVVYFSYDGDGERVRKVYEHGAFLEERVYLGEYEVFRKRNLASGAIVLERTTLAVGRDALIETKTIDAAAPTLVPAPRVRYQITDLLRSTTLELDAAGGVISYEEYFAFGGSAWRASTSAVDVSDRRYRYLGNERDEEIGLYALGERYYAAWLGRWTSPDPAGHVDGLNLYAYARNNPIVRSDPAGTDSSPGDWVREVADIFKKDAAKIADEIVEVEVETAVVDTAPALEAAPVAAAPEAAGLGVGGLGMVGALATGAAILGTGYVTFSRSNNIAQFGNPWGVPHPGLNYPTMRAAPRVPVAPPDYGKAPDQETKPDPKPQRRTRDKDKDEDKRKKKKPGRIYVTYERYNTITHLYYVGRTSMVADLNQPLRQQADEAMNLRFKNHHIDEREEPSAKGFQKPDLDKFDIGNAVNYDNRYKDLGYQAIRGREQQVIDMRGGAWSDTNPNPHKTENPIRAVAKDHLWAKRFWEVANARFGWGGKYTGN